MEKQLEFYVLIEDNGKIIKYNIFKNTKFQAGLFRIYKNYIKERLKGAINGQEKGAVGANYKNIFKQEVINELKYCFWAKCEYEIVITDWPTFISKEEINRLHEEVLAGNVKYRTTVNLETKTKIDVWDQVELNLDLFVDYLWDNLKLLKNFKDIKK